MALADDRRRRDAVSTKAIAALVLLAAIAACVVGVGLRWAALESAAAEARTTAAKATERAERAERTARENAEAASALTVQHAQAMRELTEVATQAQQDAARLATELETIRAEPTHAAPAAAVLDRVVDSLRTRRASPAAGGAPGAGARAGATADTTGPAAPSGAGRTADAGAGR